MTERRDERRRHNPGMGLWDIGEDAAPAATTIGTLHGFDLFQDGDDEQDAPDPAYRARRSIGQEIGSGPEQTPSADLYLKPGTSHEIDAGVFLWRNRAWAVVSRARNEREAQRLGTSVQKSLIAPSKLPASVAYVHNLPLFVIYGGQWVRLDPVAERTAPVGPSVSDRKRAATRKGNALFGAGSTRITGSAGAYTLSISPTLQSMRHIRRSSVKVGSIEEADAQIEHAFAAVQPTITGRSR